ncbi:adenosine nucleotide hydrolase [Flavobacterium crassostreae]|uniref:Adenosine nucleotide hydrolase n=2 Tax=Flavobacterium crassostreae TaxID=1763534 RepID=A0A1B9E856_9FLAO|nr:adenosine nucleotide hydrolase [Flavobacterium crassostreae]
MTSWSGGKDCCYAMMLAINQGWVPKVLLNMMHENGKRSRSHGLPLSILKQQAQRMQLPLVAIAATWQDYEQKFIHTLQDLKTQYHLDAAVFGDIDLQAHKDWEDMVCKAARIQSILPLWQQDRIDLVHQMIQNDIQTRIVSCNTYMGEGYLGKLLTKDLATELKQKGIDPCGENGEFHTLVVNCPLFSQPIILPEFSVATHNDYCFVVWPEETEQLAQP